MAQYVDFAGKGYIAFPDDMSEADIHSAIKSNEADYRKQFGVASEEEGYGRIHSAVNAGIRGLAGPTTSALKGIAELESTALQRAGYQDADKPEDRYLYRAGQGLQDKLGQSFKSNPSYADEFLTTKVPETVGGLAGFVPYMLAPYGAAVAGAVGALGGADTGYQDAKAHGADQDQTDLSMAANAALGGAAAAPLSHILGLADKVTGGGIKRALIAGAEGGALGVAQKVGENLIASGVAKYDPERDTFVGTGEEGAAMFTGAALVNFVVGSLSKGKAKPVAKAEPEAKPADPLALPKPEDYQVPGIGTLDGPALDNWIATNAENIPEIGQIAGANVGAVQKRQAAIDYLAKAEEARKAGLPGEKPVEARAASGETSPDETSRPADEIIGGVGQQRGIGDPTVDEVVGGRNYGRDEAVAAERAAQAASPQEEPVASPDVAPPVEAPDLKPAEAPPVEGASQEPPKPEAPQAAPVEAPAAVPAEKVAAKPEVPVEKTPSGVPMKRAEELSGQRREVADAVTEIARKINPSADLHFYVHDERVGDNMTDAAAASGGGKGSRLEGFAKAARNLAAVSLNRAFKPVEMIEAGLHELFHPLQRRTGRDGKVTGFFTQKEQRVLDKATSGETIADLRAGNQKRILPTETWDRLHEKFGDAKLSSEEQQAVLFAAYMRNKADGTAQKGLSGALYKIMGKVDRLTERVGNLLKGDGFRSTKDVFDRTASGEVGKRTPAWNGGSDATAFAVRPGRPADAERFVRDPVSKSINLGKITLPDGRKLPLRLAEGDHYINKQGEYSGFGVRHIEGERSATDGHSHIESIRENTPHQTSLDFVKDVGANGTVTQQPNGRYAIHHKGEGYKQRGEVIIEERHDPSGPRFAGVITAHAEPPRDAHAQALKDREKLRREPRLDPSKAEAPAPSSPSQHPPKAEAVHPDLGSTQPKKIGAPDEDVNLSLSPAQQARHDRLFAEEKPFYQRWAEHLNLARENVRRAIYQNVVDSLHSIGEMEKAANGGKLQDARTSVYKMADMTRDASGMTELLWTEGALKWNAAEATMDVIPGTRGLQQIFKPVTDLGVTGYKLFQQYAAARRAQRLHAEGRERLLTPADIAEGMALERQYPQFRAVFDEYQGINKHTVQLLVDTGKITQNLADKLTSDMDHVPFYRFEDETGDALHSGVISGISGHTYPFKKLKGGEAKLADLFGNIAKNQEAFVRSALRNEAMVRTMELAEGLGLARRIPSYQNVGKDSVSWRDGGKEVHAKVDDALLLQSLTSLSPVQQNALIRAGGQIAQFFRGMVVNTPGFALANSMRDTVHAWVVSDVKFIPAVDSAKGFYNALRNSASVQAIMAGGFGGHFYGHAGDIASRLNREARAHDGLNVADTPQKLADLAVSFYDKLQTVGRASEMANRDVIYRKLKEAGASEAEARHQAKNIMNFSQRGSSEILRTLTTLVPFLNARIQGLARVGEGARNNTRSFLIRGGLLMAASAGLMALNMDNPDYWNEPLERRLNYYVIFGPGHTHEKPNVWYVPKPFEAGALFSTLPELVMGHVNGAEKHAAKGLLMTFANTFQFNPTPQAVKPIIEAVTNYDFFRGRAIDNQADLRLPAGQRKDANTTGIAKAVGSAVDVSPKQIDHFISGYMGSLGMTGVAAFDSAVTNMMPGQAAKPAGKFGSVPVVSAVLDREFGRFFRHDQPTTTENLGSYYELKTEVDQLYNAAKGLQTEGRIEEAKQFLQDNKGKIALKPQLDAVGKQMAAVRKEIGATLSSAETDPGAKRERLNTLFLKRNDLADRVMKLADRAR